MRGLSVVLPAYNEAANIAGTVGQALTVLRQQDMPFEIVVVDDGSSDATAERAAADPLVRLVRHASNRGYGAALRSGFAAAVHPWIFLTDGDGQYDLGDLPGLLPLAARADIVAGYRLRRRDPWHRRLYGFVFGRVLVPATLGVRLRDVNCAFKLVRRDLVAALDLKSEGAVIHAELLGRAARAGARIVEVGVHHRPRLAGTPTGGSLRVIVRALRELLALRAEIRPGRAPVIVSVR